MTYRVEDLDDGSVSEGRAYDDGGGIGSSYIWDNRKLTLPIGHGNHLYTGLTKKVVNTFNNAPDAFRAQVARAALKAGLAGGTLLAAIAVGLGAKALDKYAPNSVKKFVNFVKRIFGKGGNTIPSGGASKYSKSTSTPSGGGGGDNFFPPSDEERAGQGKYYASEVIY